MSGSVLSSVLSSAADLAPAVLWAALEGGLAVGLVALLVRALPSLPARVRCTLWWAACLKLVLGLAWIAPVELPVLPAAAGAVPGLRGEVAATKAQGTVPEAEDTGPEAEDTVPEAEDTVPAVAPGRESRAQPGAAGGGSRAGSVPATAVPATAVPAAAVPAAAVPTAAVPTAALPSDGRRVSPFLRPLAAGAGLLWLAGVTLVVAAGWRRHRRLVRVLGTARTPSDPVLASRLTRLARRFRIPAPPVLVTPEVESPQVVGILRPRLLLPPGAARKAAGDGGGREVEMALAHELAHLRRRDLLLGWIPALARGLFFFHPLAALAAREYSLAREAACDAEVLHRLDAAPRDYGRMLLTWGAVREGGLPAAALGDHRQLKRRLIMLESSSKNDRFLRPWIVLAAALPVALLLLPVRLVAAPEMGVALDGAFPATVPAAAMDDADRDASARNRDAERGARPAPASVANRDASPSSRAVAAPAATAAPAAPAAPAAAPVLAAGSLPAPLPSLPSPPAVPGAAPVPAVGQAPAAPPAPAGARVSGSSWFWSSGDDGDPVVYVEGDRMVGFHTTSEQGRAARSLQDGDEALLWFVRDGEEYVVRDPALLARVKKAYEPVMELGRQQGELGGQQGELGGEQGELGAEQGKLGAEQGKLGAEQARLSAQAAALAAEQAALEMAGEGDEGKIRQMEREQRELEAKVRALAAEQRALAEQQRQLSSEQRAFADQQRALAEQQRALADRQREADRKARAELERVLDEALRSGKAKPVD